MKFLLGDEPSHSKMHVYADYAARFHNFFNTTLNKSLILNSLFQTKIKYTLCYGQIHCTVCNAPQDCNLLYTVAFDETRSNATR